MMLKQEMLKRVQHDNMAEIIYIELDDKHDLLIAVRNWAHWKA